jgi:hypothetical protein
VDEFLEGFDLRLGKVFGYLTGEVLLLSLFIRELELRGMAIIAQKLIEISFFKLTLIDC